MGDGVSHLLLPTELIQIDFKSENLNVEHSISMSSSETNASAGPANVQARMLIHKMCRFILPLVRIAGGKSKTNKRRFKRNPFGIEADEFVSALENFMSDTISRSQLESHDIGIETTLDVDPVDYLEAASWLWDLPAPLNKTITVSGRGRKGYPGRVLRDQSMLEKQADPHDQPISSGFDDEDPGMKFKLQFLKGHITENFPIRVLRFEPHHSKLKISLMAKSDVFNHLALKLQSDLPDDQPQRKSRWAEDFSTWMSKNAKYAILSHTWSQTPGELTYGDWQKGSLDATQPKYQKVVNFCKAAWKDHEITFGWIDSVCINKESSAELDESIRSMYAWYSNADVCITYLAGTTSLSDMHKDNWFTRGWTFQELVAPRRLKFYNAHWEKIASSPTWKNDKQHPSIEKSIQRATTMTPNELRDIRGASISRRMVLAAKRKVTREEDVAYCLMGVFDVSISTEYGEGARRAFFRLVREVFNSTPHVLDIFNWAGTHGYITSLFPSSPSDYLTRSSENMQLRNLPWRPIEPLTLTHLGLRTPMLLMPALSSRELVMDHQPIGDYHAIVSILKKPYTYDHYHLLDKRIYEPKDFDRRFIGGAPRAFGILNVEGDGTRIRIPKTCLAVLLRPEWDHWDVEGYVQGYTKEHTEKPIVFNLETNGNTNDDDKRHRCYEIKRIELEEHGMQFATLYL